MKKKKYNILILSIVYLILIRFIFDGVSVFVVGILFFLLELV